jgi:hypothetical protein
MRRVFTLLALAISIASCAKHIPEPIGLPAGTPHISWIIMHGDRDNPDAEFACQSTGPRECVLPVSRPETRVFSDVHLYLHGAGPETSYLGTYRVEFFNDGDSSIRDFQIRTTVRGNEAIGNHSITGIVTAKPGRYLLSIAVDATTSTGSTAIHENIPVQVQ